MNRRECAAVLGLMAAAWPYYELTDETVAVWADQLSTMHPEVALRTARRLIGSDERFPPIARFRATAGAVAQEGYRPSSLPPTPATGKQEALENIRRLRDLLANVGREAE